MTSYKQQKSKGGTDRKEAEQKEERYRMEKTTRQAELPRRGRLAVGASARATVELQAESSTG